MQLDDNLTVENGTVSCKHCSRAIGMAASDPFESAVRWVRPVRDVGPGLHSDPRLFTERHIVLRQIFCPGCYTLLSTEVVPMDEGEFRSFRIA